MKLIVPEAFVRIGAEGADARKYNRGAFYGNSTISGDSYFHQEKLGFDNFVIHSKAGILDIDPNRKYFSDAEWHQYRDTFIPIAPTDMTYDRGHVYYGELEDALSATYEGWRINRCAHFNNVSVQTRVELNPYGRWPGPLPSHHDPDQGEIQSYGTVGFQVQFWFTKPAKNRGYRAYLRGSINGDYCQWWMNPHYAGFIQRVDVVTRGISGNVEPPFSFGDSFGYMPWYQLRKELSPSFRAKDFREYCKIMSDAIYASAIKFLLKYYQYFLTLPVEKSSISGTTRYMSRINPPDVSNGFLFKEPEILQNKVDPGILGRASAYWINYAKEHAFVEALNNAPRMNQNSIQNCMEVLKFIKGIVVDKRIDLPSRLSDAWLTYRYSYSTTKMDAEEAIRFFKRNVRPSDMKKGFVCHGTHHFNVNNVDVTARAKVVLKSRELAQLERISNALFTYGLTPNFYVVWDAVPYSFIVDWFIPVGDMLGIVDLENQYLNGNYQISNPVYSLKYSHGSGNDIVHCYTRWIEPPPSSLNKFYWLVPNQVSSKTTFMRLADAASLIIGG